MLYYPIINNKTNWNPLFKIHRRTSFFRSYGMSSRFLLCVFDCSWRCNQLWWTPLQAQSAGLQFYTTQCWCYFCSSRCCVFFVTHCSPYGRFMCFLQTNFSKCINQINLSFLVINKTKVYFYKYFDQITSSICDVLKVSIHYLTHLFVYIQSIDYM